MPEVDQPFRASDLVFDKRIAAGIGKQCRSVLEHDVGIDEPGASDRTKAGGLIAMEDGQEPSDPPFCKLLINDVCLIQSGLWAGSYRVLDLYAESGLVLREGL